GLLKSYGVDVFRFDPFDDSAGLPSLKLYSSDWGAPTYTGLAIYHLLGRAEPDAAVIVVPSHWNLEEENWKLTSKADLNAASIVAMRLRNPGEVGYNYESLMNRKAFPFVMVALPNDVDNLPNVHRFRDAICHSWYPSNVLSVMRLRFPADVLDRMDFQKRRIVTIGNEPDLYFWNVPDAEGHTGISEDEIAKLPD